MYAISASVVSKSDDDARDERDAHLATACGDRDRRRDGADQRGVEHADHARASSSGRGATFGEHARGSLGAAPYVGEHRPDVVVVARPRSTRRARGPSRGTRDGSGSSPGARRSPPCSRSPAGRASSSPTNRSRPRIAISTSTKSGPLRLVDEPEGDERGGQEREEHRAAREGLVVDERSRGQQAPVLGRQDLEGARVREVRRPTARRIRAASSTVDAGGRASVRGRLSTGGTWLLAGACGPALRR